MSATGEVAPRAAGLLAAIVAAARRIVEVRRAREPLAELVRRASTVELRPGAFRSAVVRPGGVNVIAECKRRSPSRGILRPAYDPAAIARAYEAAGAAAVSVLTEPAFFDGSLEHVREVRRASRLPVLRKDFIVDEYQIWEARAAGADAVLLIVRALGASDLGRLHREAREAGLDVLVEIHDDAELEPALAAGATIVGVNSRDLQTLSVDPAVVRRLAGRIPPGVAAVAESGIRAARDVAELRRAGYSAFLIGEHLMTSADPGETLRALRGEAASV